MSHFKLLLIFLLIIASKTVFANDYHQINTKLKFSAESIYMPDGAERMGLLGFGYNLSPNQWVSIGPSLFGAFSGDRGGFFVLALNSDFIYPITERVSLVLDASIGGGGGKNYARDVDSGLMLRGYSGLAYTLPNNYRLGLGFSYTDFIDGTISSKSLAFTFEKSFSYLGENFNMLGKTKNIVGRALTGINISPKLEEYHLKQNKLVNGKSAPSLGTVGIEIGQSLSISHPIMIFVESAGGYSGDGPHGYMDFFAGVAWVQPVIQSKLNIIPTVSIGAGGGGARETGGGVMYKAGLQAEYALTPKLAVNLYGGYVNAPGGDFAGSYYGLKLKKSFSLLNASHSQQNYLAYINGNSFRAMHQVYRKPQRTVAALANTDVSILTIELSHYLYRYFSLIGQAGFAYGGNAGSYATGMFGVGLETPEFYSLSLEAKLLAGAGGGAAIDVQDGLIGQYTIGLNYQIVEALSIGADVGQLHGLNTNLKTTTYSIGAKYRFGVLSN